MPNLSLEERERLAYIEGRTEESALLAEVIDQAAYVCELEQENADQADRIHELREAADARA